MTEPPMIIAAATIAWVGERCSPSRLDGHNELISKGRDWAHRQTEEEMTMNKPATGPSSRRPGPGQAGTVGAGSGGGLHRPAALLHLGSQRLPPSQGRGTAHQSHLHRPQGG